MEASPKISFIVPVYQVEKYLERCLESLLGQTFRDFEVILVDDASMDGSRKICLRYQKRDARVRLVRKDVNEGLSAARNTGLEMARGRYVYFVDSDDYLDVHALERLYRVARKEDLDVCLAGSYDVFASGKVSRHASFSSDGVLGPDEILGRILKPMMTVSLRRRSHMRITAWQGLYRLSLLKEHRITFLSERVYLAEDVLFQMDVLSRARSLVFLKDPLYYYNMENAGSLTHTYLQDRYRKCTRLYEQEKLRLQWNPALEVLGKVIPRTYLFDTTLSLLLMARQGSLTLQDIRAVLAQPQFREALCEHRTSLRLDGVMMPTFTLMRWRCCHLLYVALFMGMLLRSLKKKFE